MLYFISLDPLRGHLFLTSPICHPAHFKVSEATCILTLALIPAQKLTSACHDPDVENNTEKQMC